MGMSLLQYIPAASCLYLSWSSSEESAVKVVSVGISVPDQPGTATAVVSKGKFKRRSYTLEYNSWS